MRVLALAALLVLGSLVIAVPAANADCVSTFRSDAQATALAQAQDPRNRTATQDFAKRQAGNQSAATVRDAATGGPASRQDYERSLAHCSVSDYGVGSCANYFIAGLDIYGNPLGYSPFTAVAGVSETRSCVQN